MTFVDIVARAFCDLENLGLEREVSNASTVSMIEDKLSPEMIVEWSKYMKRSKNQQLNKFPLLLEFLLEMKSVYDYAKADIRSSSDARSGSVAHVKGNIPDKDKKTKTNCWLCKDASHTIDKCEDFLNKEIIERCQLVKDNNTCWS